MKPPILTAVTMLAAIALVGTTATSAHAQSLVVDPDIAVNESTAVDDPVASIAQTGLSAWQRRVYRSVRLAARRHSLRIAFQLARDGGELIDVHVAVLSSSERDIELEGHVIWSDAAGGVWLDWKRCSASLDFGGGDFPRARVIHCSPEGDRNWYRVWLG